MPLAVLKESKKSKIIGKTKPKLKLNLTSHHRLQELLVPNLYSPLNGVMQYYTSFNLYLTLHKAEYI